MTNYDYAVIVFYFIFMLGMGWLVSRFVKTTSDYFRGGGQMVWWLVGASAFMTQFSAWTFTGAASKAYSEGWPIFVIFFSNALGFLWNAAYFAPRSRQMRLVTALEAVRERFSRGNEQLYTWLQIPLGTLYAGIWLNGLCVFLTAAASSSRTTWRSARSPPWTPASSRRPGSGEGPSSTPTSTLGTTATSVQASSSRRRLGSPARCGSGPERSWAARPGSPTT